MAVSVPVKLAYMAIAAAISYLAAYLLAPKPPKTPLDDSKTEPSTRGTILPNLLGHFRIGATMGWVGGRVVQKEKVEGAGGKGGGGDKPKQNIYYERGMHMISVGKGRSMTRIFDQGKVIWEGGINPTNTPSGSRIETGVGGFQIYWGEDVQPLCTGLAAYTGVQSTYPHIFYVYWDTKRLGTNPLWSQIEYEVTVDATRLSSGGVTGVGFFEDYSNTVLNVSGAQVLCRTATGRGRNISYVYAPSQLRLTGANAIPWCEAGMRLSVPSAGVFGEVTAYSFNASYTYIDFTGVIVDSMVNFNPPWSRGYLAWRTVVHSFNIYGWPYWGASPAVSLEQFCMQSRPWGAGFPRSLFDDSLQDVYDLLVSEETPCTSLLKSGRSWKDGIASIMQDMGILMYFDQDTGKYGFKPIREEVTTPILITQSQYDPEQLTEQFGYAVLSADTRVFTFKDSARKFVDSTIMITDDSIAKYADDPNAKKVGLETLTSFPSASRASARRDRELSVDGVMSFEGSYDLDLRIGDAVQLEGLPKIYRIVSIKENPDEAKKSFGLIEDAYSTQVNYIPLGPVGMNPGSRTQPSPDADVGLLEANRYLTPDTNGFHVLRIRSTGIVTSGFIYTSPDDTSYGLTGDTLEVTGGFLLEDFSDVSAGIVEDGPEFTPIGPDIGSVSDLSSSISEWRGGDQMCVINGEYFYLRNITATSGGNYRLNGLIRARLGTTRASHVINDPLFIFNQADLDLFATPWLVQGSDLFVKTVATASTGSTAIDDAIPYSIEPYQGGGFRPLQPANLTTTDYTKAWVAGGDAALRWDYKNAPSKTGAGLSLTNQPYSTVAPDGYFRVEIYNGSTLKRATDVVLPSFTYTNAMMVTDFGSAPTTFNVKVFEIKNGLTSAEETATITRV